MVFNQSQDELEKMSADECYEILKHTGKNSGIVRMSDDVFPDFLFNPLFTELCEEDGYFDEITDKDLKAVMNLKRRYNDIFKYYEAMEIYDRYMDNIIEDYGTKKNLIKAIKHGACDHLYVPPEPKIKQTKENKLLLKAGIVPSKQIPGWEPIFKPLPSLTQEELDSWDESELTLKDLSKEERKCIMRASDEINREDRRRRLYSRAWKNPGFDVIQEYYASLEGENRINGKGIHEPLSFADRLAQDKKLAEMTPTELEMLDYDSYSTVNGVYVRNSELAKIELYKALYDNGYDVLGQLKGSGMKNKEIKMIRKKIGAFEPMTKKEEKKWKKQEKKYGKKRAARENADKALTRLLTNNRISGEKDAGDIFNFTMDAFMRRG